MYFLMSRNNATPLIPKLSFFSHFILSEITKHLSTVQYVTNSQN